MRCFLAAEPDTRARDQLCSVMERLRAWDVDARWTHPQDLHLTLLFLDDIAEHELGWIGLEAERMVLSHDAPQLSLPGLGAFAGSRAPRIVFAAVEDRQEWCAGVHRDLAEALSYDAEPHYRPHLTLCRPRQSQDSLQQQRWPEIFAGFGQALWGPLRLTSVGLFQSVAPQDPQAPRYHCLQRWALR